MKRARVWVGLSLQVVSFVCGSSALAEELLAFAPVTRARASEAEVESAAPVTAVGPGPAAADPAAAPAPATPPSAADAAVTPAEAAPAPATPPSAADAAAAPGQQPRRFRRWTPEEIARVRAALARQRKEMQSEPKYVPGDPNAHFTLALEVSAVSRHDVGWKRFENGQLSPRFGLTLAYDLVPIHERLKLFVELGGAFESERSLNLLGFGTSSDLSSQTLHAGLGLRWDALSFLSPHVRAWGGASLFQLDVSGTSQAFDTGHATSGFGALGAGFLLHTPPRLFESDTGKLAALQLGLLVEAGYAFRSAIDFRLRTQPDARGIEVIDADLGSLSLSGWYLRFAVVLRF